MAIKEVIMNVTDLLSCFDVGTSPETLRLSKFNDPKALPNISTFLIELVNFISTSTQPGSHSTETTDELVEVAKLIGFPLWNSIKTSSYACLTLFVWLIEKIKLMPILEKMIICRLRNVLNCQSSINPESLQFSESSECYEKLLSNHYQKMKLWRLVREFCCILSKGETNKEDFAGLKLPGSQIFGSTVLDVCALNNEDMSIELKELDEIIHTISLLSKFYSNYHTFKKWVNSVSYDLQESQNPEFKLLSHIIDLQAKIEVELSDDDEDHLFDNLFVHCSSDSFVNVSKQSLKSQLAEIDEKVQKQKEIILMLVKDFSSS